MPVTRIRGKSAVHSHGPLVHHFAPPSEHIPINLNNQLLKIESVVPTVGIHQNGRHSRMIRRSHSTVSSAYLRKVADPRSRTVAALNRCNDSAIESVAEDDSQKEKTAKSFPRIKRPRKDREKFPDRINLDRKGLTAIPLIDDEPQLRLLSLQHNLINIFHVPEIDEVEVNGQATQNPAPALTTNENQRKVENSTMTSKSLIQRPVLAYNNSNRLRNGMLFHNSGLSSSSNISTSSTPSILINGVPNYCIRSLVNGKTLQSLKINQKLILKKNSFVQSLYQSSVLGCYPNQSHKTVQGDVKSASDLGLTSTGDTNCPVSDTSPAVCPTVRYGDTLHNLVFLDLYDNQIEKIGNLEGLRSLTVLLLGKNRIKDISGIVCLKNSLRVLDLHGNRITNISNKICRLQELKSLNLAGNTLRQIYSGDFAGLLNLRELNLKRNRIKRLCGFEDLQNLERLWLCNNDVHRVEDMSCIAKAINLKEITVENNPVSLAGDCCSFLVSYLPNLAMISQMHVTEQVKRAAIAWRKSKETADVTFASISSEVGQSIRREEVISNARTNWELLRSQPQFMPAKAKDSQVISEPPPKVTLELRTLSTEKQESSEPPPHEMPLNPIGTTISCPNTNEVNFFRLPPILEPNFPIENLIPHTNAENISVEDSLGANVDSTSITSSSSSSRSPSSCRSSGQASNTSEFEELKGEVGFTSDLEEKERPAVEKPIAPEEEDEGVRVAFTKTKIKHTVTSPPQKIEDIKMPIIKITENDYAADTRSNISISSSLRPEHSGTTQQDDLSNTTVRSTRNRCVTSRKLPNNAPLSRPQTAKLSPSPSTTLVVLNNISNAKGASCSLGPTGATANHSNNIQALTSAKTHAIDREREQGGDYLIEICGRYLNVYGVGALKFVDKQWNVQKAGDVHTVKFSYINFNNISAILGKIKSRFPNAENFSFRETNITCLGQLNSLAEIQGLQSIVVESEGNLICTKKWRSYAIFRLSHWGLKQINGQDIQDTELNEADSLYGQLPDLVLWSLPESLLAPLLSRLRLEEPCQASRLSAKDWLMQAEASLKCVVGKEALQWRKSPTGNGNLLFDESIRTKGQQCFNQMMENTCSAVDKLKKLESLWPTMLTEMIRNTLIDYSQMESYVKIALPNRLLSP